MTDQDRTGVLLMAYGTPDSMDAVEPYYTHIRGGRTPAPELVEDLRERYRLVGGSTPLLEISEQTRAGLEQALNARGNGRFRVVLGMKHWHPFVAEGMAQLAAEGIRRAVGLVLAPHYSSMSIAGYYRYVDAAEGPTILPIESWHLHRPYLEAVARRVQEQLVAFPPEEDVTVVFTAHSLPERILAEGDPYQDQLLATSAAVAEILGLPRWEFSYQSAGQTREPWLGPDLPDKVHELADRGVRNILVAPVGFVSDHLEILYDIDYEAQAAARERDVTLRRIEMLNASPDFVEGLADLVQQRLAEAEIRA
ncbi:MAG TPA: ferrochelatase [Chloroflexota bacterium]|nr:ferrochelatase [Chloroflexota bacterium]